MATMLMRNSNARLLTELRQTQDAYTEEKHHLRSQLANLTFDLEQLHTGPRTLTSTTIATTNSNSLSHRNGNTTAGKSAPTFLDDDGTGSHISSNVSEPELARLEDVAPDPVTSRMLHLPALKSQPLSGRGADTPASKGHKSLRFSTLDGNRSDRVDEAKSFASPGQAGSSVNHNQANTHTARSQNSRLTTGVEGKSLQRTGNSRENQERQENQKFAELQRNQEVLRNIGRAHLKEKRHNLIRLPTISSAKRRPSLWDSGKYVSRPIGKSTDFERLPYRQGSQATMQPNFRIPPIRDPQRSEIQLGKAALRQLGANNRRRKVQFTRPRKEDDDLSPLRSRRSKEPLSTSHSPADGENSLDTTAADISLGDNTIGNITFDEEKFTKEILPKILQPDNPDDPLDNPATSTSLHAKKTAGGDTSMSLLAPPPLTVKRLARKNVLLHDLQNQGSPGGDSGDSVGGSTLPVPKLRLSPETMMSTDRSYATKVSRISAETEDWKKTYMSYPDPDVRNKTLADIMFAVRSRMRDNEETLRFGETPRPHDPTYTDYLLAKESGLGKKGNPGTSPRKAGKVTKRGRRGPPSIASHRTDKRSVHSNAANNANHHGPGGAQAATGNGHLSSYLRKMYREKKVQERKQAAQEEAKRQRKRIERVAGEEYRMSHFTGHHELQMIAQEA